MSISSIDELLVNDPQWINNRQTQEATPLEKKTETVALEQIDLAAEAIKTGAAFEKRSTSELKRMEDESNGIIASIDLLIDVSREAAALNSENPKMTEALKGLLSKLKEQGILLINLEDGKEIDKDQLLALKAAAGSHIDKLRTSIQQIFTKMQTVVQNMSSVNDIIKKMMSEQSDLIRKILERSIKH